MKRWDIGMITDDEGLYVLWEDVKPVEQALENLIPLAAAAMEDANGDGAGYDIASELSEAREALAALREGGPK